jgi:hypothetical protein
MAPEGVAALVEMAKAFSNTPPFSAFGPPPNDSHPWSSTSSVSGNLAAAPAHPVAVTSAGRGQGGCELSLTIEEQFGAAVDSLLGSNDEGSGGTALGFAVLESATGR